MPSKLSLLPKTPDILPTLHFIAYDFDLVVALFLDKFSVIHYVLYSLLK